MTKEVPFSEAKPDHPDETGSQRWARWLLNVVDVALAGCIFVVPLLLGGRSAVGHFGLTIFAATAASVWWLRQSLLPRQYWRRSAAHLLLFAAIALVVLQLAPLPGSWTSQLSPKTAELLPLWNEDASAGLGDWNQVTLTPAESRSGLVLLLAYGLVFWVSVQRIRSMEDVERLLRWTAYSAVGMGLFGLIQYFTSNGMFFWVYQHPFAMTDDGVKGAFTNRNHFAHFLALGIGPVIWWVQDGMRRHGIGSDQFLRMKGMRNRAANLDTGLRVAGLVVVFLAILMSASRGGAIAAGLAALVSVAVCYRAGAVRGRFALGLTAVALLLGGFLLVGNEDSMGGRLEEMASGSIDQIDNGEGRRNIWRTTIAAIPDFGWFGSGVGSFREVYPIYMQHRDGHTIYTHAENGYLQVTLEAGYLGLALVLLAILIGTFWTGRGLMRATSSRVFVAVGAVTAAMLASVVHSGVDFVWYAPGCLVLALILAACACRINQFTHDEQRRQRDRFVLPGPIAWLAAPATVALGLWMVATQVGPLTAESHWTKYQRLQRAAYLNPATVEVPEQKGFFPDDPSELEVRKEEARQLSLATQLEQERPMVAALAETTRRDPGNARAQLALAGGYMRLFHFAQENAINRMPLSSIRDAATTAGYSSRKELEEWLSLAVGEHYRYLLLSLEHAKTAVALCPLQGEGYLYLGELCFLDVDREAETWDYVDQALQVRPYDGTVLFHAGREACLAGRDAEGLDFWLKSFAAGRIYQRQVIDLTAGRLPVGSIIDLFQPDLEILKYMQSRYQTIVDPEQMPPLLEAIALAAKEEARAEFDDGHAEVACKRWLDAMSAYMEMKRLDDAVVCGRQAVDADQHDFDARYRLGFLLADTEQFSEADEHLTWCRRTKPGHNKLKRRLAEVKRNLLDPEGAKKRRLGNYFGSGAEFMEASLRVPKHVTERHAEESPVAPHRQTPGHDRSPPGGAPTGHYTAPTIPGDASHGDVLTPGYRR
jgi:O-antigen ligase/tetratricopeptide (TPR) repeat protein